MIRASSLEGVGVMDSCNMSASCCTLISDLNFTSQMTRSTVLLTDSIGLVCFVSS